MTGIEMIVFLHVVVFPPHTDRLLMRAMVFERSEAAEAVMNREDEYPVVFQMRIGTEKNLFLILIRSVSKDVADKKNQIERLSEIDRSNIALKKGRCVPEFFCPFVCEFEGFSG